MWCDLTLNDGVWFEFDGIRYDVTLCGAVWCGVMLCYVVWRLMAVSDVLYRNVVQSVM